MGMIVVSIRACSIKFTSPAPNSILRQSRVTITGTGSGQSSPNDVGNAVATINGVIFFTQSGTFTRLMQFFGSGSAQVTLKVGKNVLRVDGTVNSCSASDTLILYYMPIDDQCYTRVTDLENLPTPTGAHRNGFIINQKCIAKQSCLEKNSLNSSIWLDKVVAAFVDPFLKQTGDWPKKLQSCSTSTYNFADSTTQMYYIPPQAITGMILADYMARRLCESIMANYHINTDLQNSLNMNGCGTEHDWNKIGDYIKDCVKGQTSAVEGWVASSIVIYLRNTVRQNCITYRKSRGLPIEY
ncbi:unnamed protein product [Rotaria sordida]|uniref:Uncharacterized protein n=1 Tax=Rotaria sordida TaxID=392033 RepID=A0A815NQE0_9BILA|nr:unnamed protein product [Rotaria sordida]CAF1439664.1 unnamed protein product [Rotaria sordida]CAF4052833.1 unnamed protein product [Rotaria sordida]